MDFYTSWHLRGNRVHLRGYNKNSRNPVFEEHRIKEFNLYTTGKNNSPTQFKTLKSEPLFAIPFERSGDARAYVKESGRLYGNMRYDYDLINTLFPSVKGVDFDSNLIRRVVVDIETESENGWPQIESPNERVNLVTFLYRGKYISFGLHPHTPSREDVTYVHCENEIDIFENIKHTFDQLKPDVITGWNTEGFDVPYLVARSKRLYGDDSWARSLSPFGDIDTRQVTIRGQNIEVQEFAGITNLDLLPLYVKYAGEKLPSYSLEAVCQHELGVGKDKNPYETMREWYTKDWKTFVEYNIIDCERVAQIADKTKFIELTYTIALRAKVKFLDTFSQVRMWETLIYNYLKNVRGVIAPTKTTTRAPPIEGAFVKVPAPGKYGWCVTFDAASLYPSIIMQNNISPETLVGFIDGMNDDKLVDGYVHKDDKTAMGANGALFSKELKGFLPEIMEAMFSERKAIKNQMLQQETRLEQIKKELKKRGVSYDAA